MGVFKELIKKKSFYILLVFNQVGSIINFLASVSIRGGGDEVKINQSIFTSSDKHCTRSHMTTAILFFCSLSLK